MQHNKLRGVAVPRGAHVRSPVGNRGRIGKTSIPPTFETVPTTSYHTASTRKKLLVGLFDPHLKSDQLEADERPKHSQHRRLLKESRQLASSQQRGSSSFPFQKQHRAHEIDARLNHQASQAHQTHKSWKCLVSPVEWCIRPTLLGPLRRESRSESLHTPADGRLFRPRPTSQWSTSVQQIKQEQLAQLRVSTRHPYHHLAAERPGKQSSGERHTGQERTHSQPARRKQFFVANQHKRPVANRIFSDTLASHLCRKQQVKRVQHERSFTYTAGPDMNFSDPVNLSIPFKAKAVPQVSKDEAQPSEVQGLKICNSSCECQGRGGRTLIWQALFHRRETPTSHTEWIQHLNYTRLRVKELCNQLTTCIFLKRRGPDTDASPGIEIMRSQWLECLLLDLADTLRTGPPGGTLRETASLLEFLRQQRSSALCAGRMRRLLHCVLLNLRRKFQRRGGKEICCKGFHSTLEQATCPPNAGKDFCSEVKAACRRSTSQIDKPQSAANSHLHGIEQQEQMSDWKARSYEDQRLILAESRNLSYKPGILVAVKQATNRRRFPCTRNNAAATAATRRVSSSLSRQAKTAKHDRGASTAPQGSEHSLLCKPRNQLREDSQEIKVLTASSEALSCLLRLEAVDSRAAATLQGYKQLFSVDNQKRKPAAPPVGRQCSSREEVSSHRADACKAVVFRVTDGHVPSPASANHSLGDLKAVKGQELREELDLQVLRCPHFPRLVQKVLAFREERMGLQAFRVPFLYEEGLQRELRQLEGSVGVYKPVDDGVAGLWTLQAATAERLLQRELQQVLQFVNDAVAAFVERLLAIEASRMAKVVHALCRDNARPQH
ncbi:hypothetical protein Esti_002516 [Eimeria stiedai]